jgi:predicted phage-related endonuclease
MALTKRQLEERLTGIGGSDAARIMSGDWLSLYEEKLQLREPEDLTWVLPVQIGTLTEDLNRRFAEHATGYRIEPRPPMFRHPLDTFMVCNLDGFVTEPAMIWEGKHVSQWLKKDGIHAQVERFYPQLMHNMHVRGVKRSLFSVIFGTLDFEPIEVPIDADYVKELRQRERQFWHHVSTKTAPFQEVPAAAQKIVVDKSALKRIAMHSSNAWPAWAVQYVANENAAADFDEAKKELKLLMPDDALVAYGSGVQVTRSASNSLTVAAYKAKKGDVVQPVAVPDPGIAQAAE